VSSVVEAESPSMPWRSRLLRWHNALWIVLLAVQFLPDRTEKEALTIYMVWFTVGIGVFGLVAPLFLRKERSIQLLSDIMFVIFVCLLAWTLATAKLNLLREGLFPTPGQVWEQFIQDWAKILTNIGSSLSIIVQGFAIGAAVAIPLGLIFGWSVRLGSAATYISKFLGSIPPVVYIPYGIALLPTFRSVSVFVIFLASFWPILASTMAGVLNVEHRIVDSAKVLNVSRFTMLVRIMLPATLPEIFIGCAQGLSVSFILLTSAEMIGARNGMGYYVKNYSDLGDFVRTVVGVLVIGIVITLIMFLFNCLQRYLLRWRR